MTLDARLKRLEAALVAGCLACRKPAVVLVVDPESERPWPCPVCGWQPEMVQITEELVQP